MLSTVESISRNLSNFIFKILQCDDAELNQWASLKRAIQIKPIKDEINEVKVYKEKKNRVDLKKKVLKSFYQPPEEENEEKMSEDDENKDESKNEEQKPKQVEKVKEKKSQTIDSSEKKQKVQIEAPKRDKASARNGASTRNISEEKSSNRKHSSKEKKHKKKKNKNVLQSMTDERLSAYGINPKKFHKKLKYSNKNSDGVKNGKDIINT